MKKLLYLPLLLLVINARAQQGVLFKIKYLPNKTYTGSVNIGLDAHVTLSGNDSIISKLKAQGITQPIAFTMNMKMDGSSQSGQPDASKSFPLKVQYKFDNMTMNMNGNAIPIPQKKLSAGVSIYAHVSPDGRMIPDSIGGVKATDTSQAHMTQMLSAIQKNIKFPTHPMHIGETFTEDMPINIPVAGNSIAAESKVTYKLISVANGNANFDVTMSMDMTVPVAGASIHMTGSGSGSMVYSIANNFATAYNTKFNMTIDGDIKTVKINATAVMDMGYNYTVN